MNWRKINSIIGAIILIAAFAGLVIKFDKTYAKEIVVVETLREFQTEQQQRSETFQLKTDYRFYKFLYDDLTKDIGLYRKMLKSDSDNLELQEEYKELIAQRRYLKQKMDSILEKIN